MSNSLNKIKLICNLFNKHSVVFLLRRNYTNYVRAREFNNVVADAIKTGVKSDMDQVCFVLCKCSSTWKL